jgi:hypothetical protein
MRYSEGQVHAARDVLGYHNEHGGWDTGGFDCDLIRAIEHADGTNRAKLSLVYPELVEAAKLYKDDWDGIAKLQERAKQE